MVNEGNELSGEEDDGGHILRYERRKIRQYLYGPHF